MTASDFKQTVLPSAQAMHRTAWRLTGGVQQEAEDLVQETFLRLWQKRDALVAVSNVEAYCQAAVRNVYLNSLRHRQPDVADASEEILAAKADTADLQWALEERDEAALMHALIARLPQMQRLAVTLRDIEGLEHADIARQLNMAEGAVRVLLSRARKQLREQFTHFSNYGR
ncbi:MAG: RNA polymerase sigma factor [Bacteroidaceae bacterium]|nr:RNA polymerase sigma factor [Bacteroidaceae bacterium]